MPKSLKTVLRSFVVVHSIFWVLIVWFALRTDPMVLFVASAVWVFTAIVWLWLVIALFSPDARRWRLWLIGLALTAPLGAPTFLGVGTDLRPLVFRLCRPSLEVAVQEICAKRKDATGIRLAEEGLVLPKEGAPRQIAFPIGHGFPGRAPYYIWRADDKKPEGRFRVETSYAPHWFEATWD
ncbi:MAG: hypothetical protein QM758_18730 [Armatimonas sp.]